MRHLVAPVQVAVGPLVEVMDGLFLGGLLEAVGVHRTLQEVESLLERVFSVLLVDHLHLAAHVQPVVTHRVEVGPLLRKGHSWLFLAQDVRELGVYSLALLVGGVLPETGLFLVGLHSGVLLLQVLRLLLRTVEVLDLLVEAVTQVGRVYALEVVDYSLFLLRDSFCLVELVVLLLVFYQGVGAVV